MKYPMSSFMSEGKAKTMFLIFVIKTPIYDHGSSFDMSVICAFIFRYVNRQIIRCLKDGRSEIYSTV